MNYNKKFRTNTMKFIMQNFRNKIQNYCGAFGKQ